MFTSYCDAAGGRDHGFVVVAGFVSTFELWQRFEVDWTLVLAKANIPYLHMKAFSQSLPPYAHLKDKEGQRKNILRDLAEVIASYARHAFSTVVYFQDFDRVNQIYSLAESLRTPYAVCAFDCIMSATTWARDQPFAKLPMEYIFEEGDDGWASMEQFAVQKGYPRPLCKPSRDRFETTPKGEHSPIKGILELQAADFLAYELRKATSQLGPNPPRWKYRQSALALGRIGSLHTGFSGTQLEQFCGALKIQKREQSAYSR